MSRGILIFAFNNSVIDYVKQAIWVADRVERFLNLPTTIVTSKHLYNCKHKSLVVDPQYLSTRNFDLTQDNFVDKWHNAGRYEAYDLSPYDETIVIDSDYIVNSDQLNLLFESPHDFLCHRTAYDVANKDSLVDHQTIGSTKFPHYWATVMFFRQTNTARNVFDYIEMIRNNYKHYSELYKFTTHPFRNDFAVSIALSIAYGHRINSIPTIPWNLPTAIQDIDVTQSDYRTFNLMYNKWANKKERAMTVEIKDQDFHCLNKIALEKMIDG